MTTYQRLKLENATLKKELIILATHKENEFSLLVEEIRMKWKLKAQIEKQLWAGSIEKTT